MKWIVHIDHTRCTGCGECVDNCPGDVFLLEDSRARVAHPDDCHGCHTCEDVCGESAVQVDEGE